MSNQYVKGAYGGVCNRTACNNFYCYYFNPNTNKYYCMKCAQGINECVPDTMIHLRVVRLPAIDRMILETAALRNSGLVLPFEGAPTDLVFDSQAQSIKALKKQGFISDDRHPVITDKGRRAIAS